jgi:DNA-binding transcriptional ArsR family regulator
MTTTATTQPTAEAACCAPLGAPSLSDEQAEATARLFKALADPHRVKIVNLLATRPRPGLCMRVHRSPQPEPADGQSPPQEAGLGQAAGPRAARHLGLLLAAA